MTNKSFGFAVALALVCFLSFSGCSESVDSKNRFASTSTANTAKVKEQPTPRSGNVGNVSPPKSNPFALTEEEKVKGGDSIIKDVKAEINILSKAIGLPDLKKRNLRENEKEFRFWIIDSPKTLTGFVAFQKNSENLAFKVINNRSTEKIERVPITDHELDWNNWWPYIDSQMGSMREKQSLPALDLDVEFYAIEVASSKDYVFAMYSPEDLKNGDKTLTDLCKTLETNFRLKFCKGITGQN